MRLAIVILFLTAGAKAAEYPPDVAYRYAAADVRKLPAAEQPQARYFWLGNLPPEDREDWCRVLSGHVNTISTEGEIVKPAVVPGTQLSLLRINVGDYGKAWKTQWERLAEVDPWFHVAQEQEWDYGAYDAYNRWVPKYGVKRVASQAPWLTETKESQQDLKALSELTQSNVPVVRGDWFLKQTAIQSERSPGYYDFLGLKTQADFFKLVGFDAKLASGRELREAVSKSGVAKQPRRIERQATVGGGLWRTFDNKKALDRKGDQRNPERTLNDDFKFDASEEFGPGPNGFMIFFLANAEGERQDSAPDFVGHDKTTTSNDGRIHIGLSCIRCHGQSTGINDIDYWARGLFQPPLKLIATDEEEFRKLRRQYLKTMEPHIEDDRRVYDRAVLQATGVGVQAWSRSYARAWKQYEDSPADAARAARDWGMEEAEFKKRLLMTLEKHGQVDTVLGAFIRGKSIETDQYEEITPLVYMALKGYAVPAKVK